MEKTATIVYIGLGTNIGNKPQNLFDSINFIDQRIGRLVKSSNFYSTPPFEMQSKNDFWNACIQIETYLNPFEILEEIQKIEQDMGRAAKSINKNYQDRIIDIDLLFFGNECIEDPKLTLPHPEWQNRLFVLVPLNELIDRLNISGNCHHLAKLINKLGSQAIPKQELKFF
ncbi:MAG: 2-amino-4-hydroxy-6-hydroxymethyldihydropteridine diphosphokinase [Bacteroidetes bacterium]|nr:2-amino-4-hydroxy-6-hydroxymethyldihydropteridine diphosphokinase [Bacteroidota bacterium]